jgi:hypothetical protein
MTGRFILSHATARSRAQAYLAEAPEGWIVSIRPPNRNTAQNALLHSLIGEVAKQVEWAGKRWDIDDWKRLLTAAWMRTRNQQALMVPAVDGHGFEVLYQRTSSLSKAECAELIDFIQAWAAERGVQTHEREPA